MLNHLTNHLATSWVSDSGSRGPLCQLPFLHFST
uniref:Uncharacterized protein n=1 Tax=Anguilla anguilla TaxID=7936 RepID=A0A0E9VUG7_ANGAN